MTAMRGVLRKGAFLHAARVRRWAGMCLLAQVLVAGIAIAGTHGWLVTLQRPTTTDFVSFYAAGTLARGADAALVYDRAVHFAAEQAATSPGIGYVYFFYPPVFLLYCRALSLLPYLAAFILFQAIGLAACFAVVRAILPPPRPRWWWWAALSFSPVLWTVCIGQNPLLTAAMFGGGTLLLHQRRRFAAGLVFGLLFYKPHTGLLLPVALLAAREWRAIAGAALSVCGGVGASLALFGTTVWRVFFHALAGSQRDFVSGAITPFTNTVSVLGALRDHGAGAHAAVLAQIATGLAVAGVVAWCWRPAPTCARYALLISGALLAMPVVLFYDLTALVVAGAWIVRDARDGGFLPGEKATLAFVWLAGLLCYPLAHAAHMPLGLAATVAVFVLAARRQMRADYHPVNSGAFTIGPASFAIARMQPAEPKNGCSTLNATS